VGEMSEREWRAFLTERARTAKVSTTRPDGHPHVTPVWFDLDADGTLVFTTDADSVKGRSLRRDPRVSLCVDDDAPPFAFVIIEGTVSLSEDPTALTYWATRIGGRYMGGDRAEFYGRRNAVPGELVVRVTPARVLARSNIAG
jgi:PPOX class probable F420-dependent enzyme